MWSNSMDTPTERVIMSHIDDLCCSSRSGAVGGSRTMQRFLWSQAVTTRGGRGKTTALGRRRLPCVTTQGLGSGFGYLTFFFVFYFVASSGAESVTVFSRCLSACSPSCSPLFADGCKDTRNMPMEACLTKMAGRSEM